MAADSIAITSFVPVAPGAAPPGAVLPGEAAVDFRVLFDERLLTLIGAAEAPAAANPSAGAPPACEPQDPALPAAAPEVTLEPPPTNPFLPVAPVSNPAALPVPAQAAGTDATTAAATAAATAVATGVATGVASAAVATALGRDARATTLWQAPAMRGAIEPAVPIALPERTSIASTHPLAPAILPDLLLTPTHRPEHDVQRIETPLLSVPPAPPAPAPVQSAPASITLAEPVTSPHWPDALGERLVLVAREGAGSAELHVHPAELGPISVRIDVRGDQASIVFGAAHADARNALEAALPRLVESFAAQGLALANAHVGAQLARDGGGDGFTSPGSNRESASGDDRGVERVGVVTRRALGIVDTFA